ncbi:MAG: carboxypeptidase regulatory-like domain-containing protein [Candidatus Methanoperedens sp.]|nr:carboxypeptidase regulatory-like domain-containing protein [Candidatus Methanoperedens sp.]
MNEGISGHVYSESGSALGSAGINCNGNRSVTLFDGAFELGNLAPGTYSVTASLKGFKSQTSTVTVEKDKTAIIDFYLPRAKGTSKICGIVYDAGTGKPVASGGTVILVLPVTNKYSNLDKEGRYFFTDLAGDGYNIVTSVSGYEDGKVMVDVEEGREKVQDIYCKPVLPVEPPWG